MKKFKYSKKIRFLLQFMLSLILTIYLLQQIELPKVKDVVNSIQMFPFLYVFFLTIVSYVLRSLRFQLSSILSKKIHLKNYFAVTCLYNIATSLLPSGTGEISYPYLMKKYFNINLGESLISVFVSRVCQMLFLIFFLIFSFFFIQELSLRFNKLIFFSLCFALLIVIVLLVWTPKVISFINEKLIKGKGFKSLNGILLKMQTASEMLISTGQYSEILILSFFITLINITTLYFLFRVFNFNISFIKTIFCLSFLQISAILPIHNFGKIGTYESIAVLAFIIIGIPKADSIILGFSIHLAGILVQVVLSIIGLIILKKNATERDILCF